MAKKNRKLTECTLYDIARVFALHKEEHFTIPSLTRICGYKKRSSYYIEEMVGILEHMGIVTYTQGFHLALDAQIHTGTIVMTRGGASFCDIGNGEDIFIPHDARYGACAHDIVNILVLTPAMGGRKAEGCVIYIRSKGKELLPAQAKQKISRTSFLFVSLYEHIPAQFIIEFSKEEDIPYNIFRLVYTVAYGEEKSNGLWYGHLVECLGIEERVSTQEKIVQIEYALPREFPLEITEYVTSLPCTVEKENYPDRKHLDHMPFVTIDGEDSRDFDDAIYVEQREKGYTLYVAIADVAAYVHEGDILDEEALSRSNSYYFPKTVLPMLPQELSNGICSLNPHVLRLAMVVEIHCADDGSVLHSDVYEAIIQSHQRLTYTEVQTFFDGGIHTIDDAIQDMLTTARELAQKLYHIRYRRGALFFTTKEPYFSIEKDKVENIAPYPRYESHMIIEEYMLLANECIAKLLEEQGYPVVYRTHAPPAEEKLEILRKYASYCFPKQQLPSLQNPYFLHELLDFLRNQPQENIFHSIAIRSMMQARYSFEHEGHYGLQSESYCHFTSPIRRYADCLVHRIVKSYLQGKQVDTRSQERMLHAIDVMNKNERIAMNAERDIQKRLSILYMKQYLGMECQGIISGIHYHSLSIELPQYTISATLLLSSLSEDYYEVIENQQRIQGQRTKNIYALGDSIDVIISRASLETMEIECSVKAKQQRKQQRRDARGNIQKRSRSGKLHSPKRKQKQNKKQRAVKSRRK